MTRRASLESRTVPTFELTRGVSALRVAWLDYTALLKLRITTLVGLSAFVGGLLAAGPAARLGELFAAALWIACSGAAASVFNQVLERDTDRLMVRTQDRPLASRRLPLRNAILLGAVLACASTAALALRFNLLVALLSLASLFVYVAIYTPLKRVSTLNTVIGAVAGASPPLLGFVALAGETGPWAWALFAILFVWQFPHFMAIAWIYRADYARAGMRMLPAIPGCEGMAARSAFVYALVLLPVALLPGVWGDAGIVYSAGALAAGLVYAACAAAFATHKSPRTAKRLLFASLCYLPALYSLILLDPVVGVAALYSRT